MNKREQPRKTPDFVSGPRGRWFESRHSDHVVADFVSFATIFFEKSSLTHAVAPPSRKRSRSAQLFACKRAHDAALSLPTFCGVRSPAQIRNEHLIHETHRDVFRWFSFFSKVFLGFLRSANMCVPVPYECRDTRGIYPFVFSPTKSCSFSDAKINVADTSPTPRHRSHKSNRSISALLPSQRQGFLISGKGMFIDYTSILLRTIIYFYNSIDNNLLLLYALLCITSS